MLLAGAWRGAEHTFSEHLELQPMLHIIMVRSSSKGAGKALGPHGAKLFGDILEDGSTSAMHNFKRGHCGL